MSHADVVVASRGAVLLSLKYEDFSRGLKEVLGLRQQVGTWGGGAESRRENEAHQKVVCLAYLRPSLLLRVCACMLKQQQVQEVWAQKQKQQCSQYNLKW